MHQIVVTKGIVLGKRALGEGSSAVFVLTQELGLVRARAQGARLAKSKLRYGLEVLTQARYSFVRGKNEWRLVGVEHISREFSASPLDARKRLGQVVRLLLRLLPGQEGAPALFATVQDGFAALAHTTLDADALECVLVLRILAHLGYVPELPALSPFVESDVFTPELAQQAQASRKLLIKFINDSLQATGL